MKGLVYCNRFFQSSPRGTMFSHRRLRNKSSVAQTQTILSFEAQPNVPLWGDKSKKRDPFPF